jgi:hypothetical protein
VDDTGKRKPPNAGKGRPKGSLNATTRSAKEAIEAAAEGLGGVARLIQWAQEAPENERAFWASVYPKLLPLTTNVSGSMTINWPLNPASRERG